MVFKRQLKNLMSFFKNKFFPYSQMQGKSFDKLVTSLQKLFAGCEFGELAASLLDKINAFGVRSSKLREFILRVCNCMLQWIIRLGKSAEETQKHVKALKEEAEISERNNIFKPSPQAQSKFF